MSNKEKEENKKEEIKENVIVREVAKEMKTSYMEYAMSVIISRALPDARDGLKPIHRRILYTMYLAGLFSNKPYRKSAATIGDVLGKFHPHGDAAVYDSMVRMAQNFSLRYPLIDGHGNFGSIDGDPAAAFRYTEARLAKIAEEMLVDITKETVDFMPNYDNTLKEPMVLPSKLPQLLINGSSGIAVGMATNMAPHNIGEVVDGMLAYLDNKDITVDELMKKIPGPDFPTGAQILGRAEIKKAYETGRGKIKLRGELEIEPMTASRNKIVIHSLPYQVNKATLIEKIVELAKEKRIDGISEVRDESDKDAQVRVVIELKRDVNANIIVNQLFKYTQLELTFGIINLALVKNEPKLLPLKEQIEIFINHRKIVIVRRTKFDLDKTEARLHILDGLKIAIDNIDEVIRIIKASYDDPKEKLMERFGLSDIQAQAILDMRLKTLSGLQIEKINEEYDELMKLAKYLRSILESEQKQIDIIKEELTEMKEKYNDERRTKIVADQGEIEIEDLIDDEDSVIALTNHGYIKRMPVDTYKNQNRGGKGITGMNLKENDFINDLFVVSTLDHVLFFSNKGKLYRLQGYQIPEASRTARGTAIVNILPLEQDEKINAVIPIKKYSKDNFLVMATKNGIMKKTNLAEYETSRTSGLKAIALDEGDELISIKKTTSKDNIIVGTKFGKCIFFNEKELRPLGRNTRGVKAITLGKDDEVIGMDNIHDDKASLLTITENGFGKRTELSEYTVQKRGGKGVFTHKLTGKTGSLIGIKVVEGNEDLMLITDSATVIRLSVKDINMLGRATSGVTLIRMEKGVSVVSFETILPEEEIEKEME